MSILNFELSDDLIVLRDPHYEGVNDHPNVNATKPVQLAYGSTGFVNKRS